MDEYIYCQSVHKDFHGITNYLIGYLRENYGKDNMEKFFKKASLYIYKPLIERIKKDGLIEMKKHLERTFSKEDGKFEINYSDNQLIFKVKKCPAIWQMKDNKIEVDKNFCFISTDIVNKAIASKCGIDFSVEYNQENGSCMQKFTRKEKQ
jgi:hypothetical protein